MEWIKGIIITLQLTIVSLLGGATLGVIFAIISSSKNRFFKIPVDSFIFIIKGTPMLVQIFILYYGLGQIGFIKQTFLWELFKRPFFCAALALSINSASYMSSLIKNAIISIPKGQILAAKTLGLPKINIIIRIITPQVIKNIIPAYSNEAIILLKSTSLACSITLMDTMGIANNIISKSYNVTQTLAIVGIIYFILNLTLTQILSVLKKQFS